MYDPAHNPYQSAFATAPAPPAHRKPTPGHVMAPAIALIVVGVINMLFAINGFIRNVTGQNDNDARPANFDNLPPAAQELYRDLEPHKKTINLSFGLLGLVSNVVIIAGGAQMARLRMYPLALAGTILAALPCLGLLGCCGIGQGVAIWSLVVLCSGDVRSRFG